MWGRDVRRADATRPTWALAALVVLVLLLPTRPTARAEETVSPVAKEVTAARKQLVKALHRVATWARDNKLFTWRVGVLKEILTQDPDNRQARSALRHRWDSKTKTWDTSTPYEPPADKDKSLLPDAQAKRDEAHAGFRDARIVERHQIHVHHPVAALDQIGHDLAAGLARSAGEKNAHAFLLFFCRHYGTRGSERPAARYCPSPVAVI